MIGIGPPSPCHGLSPNSASASMRRNAGRTSAKLQPGFPRAAQASKSAAAPRTANRVSQEVPPRTRPRRSLELVPASFGSDSNPQSGTTGRRHPSAASVGVGRSMAGPASSRMTDRSGSAARRLATTQPAAPAPTTAMSNVSFVTVPLRGEASLRIRLPGGRWKPLRGRGDDAAALSSRHERQGAGHPPRDGRDPPSARHDVPGLGPPRRGRLRDRDVRRVGRRSHGARARRRRLERDLVGRRGRCRARRGVPVHDPHRRRRPVADRPVCAACHELDRERDRVRPGGLRLG